MDARVLLLLAAAAALPLAGASARNTGALEADAPVAIDGQADTLLPAGIASFVSGPASTPIIVRLHADEAQVLLRTHDPRCAGLALPEQAGCPPAGTSDSTIVLQDVTLAVVKPLSSYKLVVTTDRSYAESTSFGGAGDLIVTTGQATRLTTNAAPLHLSGTDPDWAGDAQQPVFEPIYAAEADSAQFSAGGAVFRALDGFEAFFQGLQITVIGTDEDGDEFRQTYDTRVPDDPSAQPSRVLVVEVTGGDLQATSSAPFVGFAPASQRPITDVHTRARLEGATGSVGDEEHSDATVTLTGPLSLQLTKAAKGRLAYTVSDGLRLGALADAPDPAPPIPAGALAAAGAAGASGAGALIALAYFWPRLKYAWTLAFLPMYTRIERDAVLEHEKRDELYELIRATPGIHAHEIGEKANIGWGTTVYHLKLLENHGLIVSKKSGRYKRFFVNTGEYTKKKDVYGALRNETAKAVADYVVNHPGTTQKELCAALGIQPSLASWHVEKLEGVELVKRVKDGRMVRYFAGPAWADLNVRVNPLGGGDAPAET